MMRHGRRKFIAAFLGPPLLLYGVFVLNPYVQAFYLSLTDWGGFSAEAEFVGLDNFRKLFSDQHFWSALRNNAVMLAVIPVVTVAAGLLITGLLHFGGRRKGAGHTPVRGAGVYKILFFLPQVLAVSVVGVLWQFIYTPRSGLLNAVLDALGLDGLKHEWLADPRFALSAVMVVMIWSTLGFYIVLFGAAMQAIPSEVLEAAALDGASKPTAFFRIVLPMVWESVQVSFIALGIMALDGFAFVQIMTIGPGGPGNSTEVLGLSLWNNSFKYGQFGYATAFGVVLFLLTMVMAVFTFKLSRRDSIEG
ncbi:sugar ABC transporter permease [Streptomyces bobili]|uniref:carbohydrate ABC transporter permease n=1 Tax=Streptomyces bobili TaxID=67280 RepID=UPI003438C02B